MARPTTGAYVKPVLHMVCITVFLDGIVQDIELKSSVISAVLNHNTRKYSEYSMLMKTWIIVDILI